jgi:6-pyruvoyltetrahydropterin/6-carboxytetrahydropterin synthase
LGEPLSKKDDPQEGMVMDFAELKAIVEKEVLYYFDHVLVLHEDHPFQYTMANDATKLVKVSYQPTCENLLLEIKRRIRLRIQPPLQLHSLKLYETGSCYAEWIASDNESS